MTITLKKKPTAYTTCVITSKFHHLHPFVLTFGKFSNMFKIKRLG